MLTTPHVLTGAAVGVATGNPIAGFIAGLASHIALDAIPHTDPGTWHMGEPYPFPMHAGDWTVGLVDLFVAGYSLLYLAGHAPLLAAGPIAGVIGGVLPDVIGLSPLFYPPLIKTTFMQRYIAFMKRGERTARPDQWVMGLVTQAVVVVGVVWYLIGS